MARPARKRSVFLRLQDLLAAVAAALQVDVVRTPEFPRLCVFDVRVLRELVVRPAHAPAGGRGFSLRNGHGRKTPGSRGSGGKAGLIGQTPPLGKPSTARAP